MRADRLLQILLTLEMHGRQSATQLAQRLEVSVRTVQRDMDALGAAGVPVYATRGPLGGWQLTEGYRSGLGRFMGPDDALSIVAGRVPRVLADLGLGGADDGALVKLMAAFSPEARDVAEHARQRLHVDLAPWGVPAQPSEVLRTLQQATWEDRRVLVQYRTSGEPFLLCPLGLVAKGMVWYLVADRDGALRTYRVSRIVSASLTDERFERPRSFDLAEHWREAGEAFRAALPTYLARLRVRGPAVSRLGWSSATVVELGAPDHAGWRAATVDLESEPEAVSVVLGLAPDVVVDDPPELGDAVTTAAGTLVERQGEALRG